METKKKRSNISPLGIIFFLLALISSGYILSYDKNLNSVMAEVKDTLVAVEDAKISPENEGKPVLISGKLYVKNEIKDEEFNVSVKSSKLNRTVYIYRWDKQKIETEDDDAETRYEWVKVWSNRVEHPGYKGNPTEKPIEDKEFINKVYLGDFTVNHADMKRFATKSVTSEGLDATTAKRFGLTVANGCLTNAIRERANIGDVMIEFTYVDLDAVNTVSMVGMQKGNELVPYIGKGKGTLHDLWTEQMSKDDVFNYVSKNSKGRKILAAIVFVILGLIGLNFFRRKKEGNALREQSECDKETTPEQELQKQKETEDND